MKRLTILILLFRISLYAYSQSYPSVAEIKNPVLFNEQLRYTSSLLHQPNTEVRILVYGQSISVQEWWRDVKTYFEKKYSNSKLNIINKAIGGFSSDRLKLTVANDVASFYPDLILFHDYGSEEEYEKIIRIIQSSTTADIAIQTDHVAQQGQEWHDKHSNVWLPELCKKYGLALLDVRKYWKQYIAENKLQIKDLLSDGVHLNKQGNFLMAGIIKNYFDNLSYLPLADKRITILTKGKNFSVKKGVIQVPFTGNRIDVQSDATNSDAINILVDKQSLKNNERCFYFTRPSLNPDRSFLTNIGLLLDMEFTDKTKKEDWSLTIVSVDSVQQQISYTLKGSVTGEDGSGNSGNVFTSKSGSIIIKPEPWFRRRDPGDFSQFRWLKPGDVLKWQVRSMCHDSLSLTSLDKQTLFQGIENGAHQLTIKGPGVKNIKKIIVYKPLLNDN